MKKIIILIPYLSGYGGTEVVIHNLLNEYFRRYNETNINLSVYSLGGFMKNNYLKFSNVHIIKFPNNSFIRKFLYLILLPMLIFYLLLKIHPDAVISTTPVIWAISQIFSRLFHMHIPVIAWYHYSYNAKPVKKFFLMHSNYFFTISNAGKNTLIRNGIESSRIFNIYNPVIPTKKIIKNSKHHNHLIYIGRLEYKNQKNISELFKALSLIKNRSWQLRIYGTGPDENKLKLLSKKLNIFNNIIWMGFIHNIWNNINVADTLILTSNYEGFPMVLVEAISHGLYVISSNCHDGPSEIINKNNGSLYKVHDIRGLAKLIKSVIEGKKIFNKRVIQNSISNFYIYDYYERFVDDINHIID